MDAGYATDTGTDPRLTMRQRIWNPLPSIRSNAQPERFVSGSLETL